MQTFECLTEDNSPILENLCQKPNGNVIFFEQSGVDDPNFAYDLLTELTRTFLAYADDVRAQDSAAYAIQVLTLSKHSICS